jgi:hypothetical protein
MLAELKALGIEPSATGSQGTSYYLEPDGQSIRFRDRPSTDGFVTGVAQKWLSLDPGDLRAVDVFLSAAVPGSEVVVKKADLQTGNHLLEFQTLPPGLQIIDNGNGRIKIVMPELGDGRFQYHFSSALN